ncbi:MAG TPA: NAD(P)/FAD-dependent oxidoreductase [Polyangiaceae bacterium]|nr:NAD(P)/FAD-dependent oxidoreductase [Polyangiaceae bacterium]
MKKHAVVIVGGGPGGSSAAAWLAQRSVDVAVIEREDYPRFHIGESLLPASMPVFKETGVYDTLSSGSYIRKFGARFIDYGNDDEIYFGFQDGLNPDIPMAFEVPRADFDRDLLQHAQKSGATLYQPERVVGCELSPTGVILKGQQDEYHADYLIDASGRDSVIGKQLDMRRTNKDLNNIAVFAHYRGVARQPGLREGDITIGLLPDRAWTWLIPFKGEITSVGVVCSSAVFDGQGNLPEYLERRLCGSQRVRDAMRGAQLASEVMSIGNYSHSCDKFFGERWILSGDAAMFLDPIFSSGVHLSVSSSVLAARAVHEALQSHSSLDATGAGRRYEEHFRLGAGRFRNLIGLFYEGNFVGQMKKVLERENLRKGFTSAVAGDVWNEQNFLFQKGIL